MIARMPKVCDKIIMYFTKVPARLKKAAFLILLGLSVCGGQALADQKPSRETSASGAVGGGQSTTRSVVRTLGQVDHLHQRNRAPLPAGEEGDIVAAARAAVVEEISPSAGSALPDAQGSDPNAPRANATAAKVVSPRTTGATPPSQVKGGNGLGQTLIGRECDAAERGDPAAAYRLGRRYLFGLGVMRDKRMGVAWMRAAASRGFGPARQVALLVPANWGRMRPWCRLGTGPVRSVTPPPAEIVKLVEAMAPGFGLDPHLVLAVIQVESAYRTNAVSPKEAAGLMQLIPGTAARFGVRNVFDAEDNIRGGMRYLRWLLSYFRGNLTYALAGYNAGEGAVDRHGGVPPYAETQAYVRLVHRLYPQTQHPFDAGAVATPSVRVRPQTAEVAR